MRIFDTQDNIYRFTGALLRMSSLDQPGEGTGMMPGVWRNLHTHSWASSNNFIQNAYNGLLSGIFRSTQVLEFDPTPEQAAQARFLRAFFAFHLVDNFGLVLGREPGEDLTQPPSIYLNRPEGINFVISELEEILNDLPDSDDPSVASQNAAHFLLAKAYLNKAVYMATNESTNGASEGPFTFDTADMNKVIEHADADISFWRL